MSGSTTTARAYREASLPGSAEKDLERLPPRREKDIYLEDYRTHCDPATGPGAAVKSRLIGSPRTFEIDESRRAVDKAPKDA